MFQPGSLPTALKSTPLSLASSQIAFIRLFFIFQMFNIHDLKQCFMFFAPVGYLLSPYFAPEPDGTWGRMVVFSGRNNRLSDSGAWQ
jgi:hypothetical protein